jgi:hypothetical protein
MQLYVDNRELVIKPIQAPSCQYEMSFSLGNRKPYPVKI